MYQTFEFPLADFVAANPKLDPTVLHSLRLVFDRTEKGAVYSTGSAFARAVSEISSRAAARQRLRTQIGGSKLTVRLS